MGARTPMIGSEDRLSEVELIRSDAPMFGVAGKALRVTFRIVSWLPGDRDITVSLAGLCSCPDFEVDTDRSWPQNLKSCIPSFRNRGIHAASVRHERLVSQ